MNEWESRLNNIDDVREKSWNRRRKNLKKKKSTIATNQRKILIELKTKNKYERGEKRSNWNLFICNVYICK